MTVMPVASSILTWLEQGAALLL